MTAEPPGEEFQPPTSADASRILAELSPVTQRSWRLARDAMLARPLLAWGLAWAAGAIVYQFVAGPPVRPLARPRARRPPRPPGRCARGTSGWAPNAGSR
jgi:hypothetical protein